MAKEFLKQNDFLCHNLKFKLTMSTKNCVTFKRSEEGQG